MADTGTRLSEETRMQAARDLSAAARTATTASWLLEHDPGFSPSSLLEDITAIEAVLKRIRQSVAVLAGEDKEHA